MKRKAVLFIKILLSLVVLFAVYVIGALVHGTVTDFKPEKIIQLEVDGKAELTTVEDSVLTFVNWNVGYGGLGAETNFFYDSGGFLTSKGKMIRSTKEMVEKNVKGMKDYLGQNQADFILLQEVDFDSKRSYHTNEHKAVCDLKPKYAGTFAVNYKAPRVPLPVFEFWRVMGKMHSGLGTYSRFQPTESTRYQFPGEYDWPTKIFQLDRCFALQRYPTKGGNELIVINTHNSAYDNGSLKKQQMAYLRDMVLAEYAKGNYVIVGGDWNQCPPNFKFDKFSNAAGGKGYSQVNIAQDYLPADWRWAYDPATPTNRKLTNSYEKGKTFTTLIDYYLVSPNVEILEVKTDDLDFAFSDHQPVRMKVRLK